MVTLVEGVETDDFNFEVAVEGHLAVDVITEGSLAGRTASRHADDDLLVGLLH